MGLLEGVEVISFVTAVPTLARQVKGVASIHGGGRVHCKAPSHGLSRLHRKQALIALAPRGREGTPSMGATEAHLPPKGGSTMAPLLMVGEGPDLGPIGKVAVEGEGGLQGTSSKE